MSLQDSCANSGKTFARVHKPPWGAGAPAQRTFIGERLLLHQAAFQFLDRWRCETAQEKQRQLKSLRVIQKMLHRAAGAFGQWAVTARKPEERKQVVMQKVMKRLQHLGKFMLKGRYEVWVCPARQHVLHTRRFVLLCLQRAEVYL